MNLKLLKYVLGAYSSKEGDTQHIPNIMYPKIDWETYPVYFFTAMEIVLNTFLYNSFK